MRAARLFLAAALSMGISRAVGSLAVTCNEPTASASSAVTGFGLGASSGSHLVQPATINIVVFVGQSTMAGAYGLEAGIEQDANGTYCGTSLCNNLQTWDDAAAYNGDANTYTLAGLYSPIHANNIAGGIGAIDAAGYGGGTNCVDYPHNICGETPAERSVNEATLLFRNQGFSDFRFGAVNVGRNGYFLSQIYQGTLEYNRSLSEVVAFKRAAAAGVPAWNIPPGSTVLVTAVVVFNGEADCSPYVNGGSFGNDFARQLQAFQATYQTDLQAATGQSRAIPLLVVQQTGFCLSTSDYSSQQQIIAGQQSTPGQVLYIGTRQNDATSTIGNPTGNGHFSTLGDEQIAEHAVGKYLWRVENYLEGLAPWPVNVFAPLIVAHGEAGVLNSSPGNPDPGTFARVSGNTFSVKVTVPFGPVAATGLLPHQTGAYAAAFSACQGWEGWTGSKANDGGVPQANGSPVTCNSVTVTSNPSGANVVATFQIAFASAIDTIAYGYTADSTVGGFGVASGRVGPWTDSDTTATISGRSNPNQLASFYQGGMDTL